MLVRALLLLGTPLCLASVNLDLNESGFLLDADKINVKYPTKVYDAAHIEPPRITAGCGGIDFFKGSISMLSADDYIDMLPVLAQNTKGVMIKLALKDMMPSLSRVVDNVEALMNEWNLHNIDTCQMAEQIANPLYSKIKQAVTHDLTMKGADKNEHSYTPKSKQKIHLNAKPADPFWLMPKALSSLGAFSQQEVTLLVQILGDRKIDPKHNNNNKNRYFLGSLNEFDNSNADYKECLGSIKAEFIGDTDSPILDSEKDLTQNFVDYSMHLKSEIQLRKPLDFPEAIRVRVESIVDQEGFVPPIIPYLNSVAATGMLQVFDTFEHARFGKLTKDSFKANVLHKFIFYRNLIISRLSDISFAKNKTESKNESDSLTPEILIKDFEKNFVQAEEYLSELRATNHQAYFELEKRIYECDSYIETKVARDAKIAFSA